MNFIYFIAGIVVGGVTVWIYFSNKNKDAANIKNVLSPLENKLNEFTTTFQNAYRDEADREVLLKEKLKH